ncbi:WD40-repeat-containing domain protein [Thamnocephalis sphaerospora]|uniref:Protein HIR n=1 Tax=Thamnocephalis sphaerospora TaxID=78915 RepID=A0A4P9XQC6_9FUNG|nr:WD40-repeat-containing domain protein [Thamnocephalis sphaerospora]|eukprot:RKP08235.1 WD40-repeat-containing domain protein [Thamnocephalis sphaerospora]
MYISKPAWIGHLDERQRPVNIFSIDAHPDGTRLATGGLDTKVKIWSTAPLFRDNTTAEPEGALLCTLALHDGAVLCVRWSNDDGRFLASGSDDKIIVIWTLDTAQGGFGGVFGSLDGAQNLENWKAVKRLVGHESDVTDLAWSADNAYLASCGLDSKVIVWDGSTFEMVKTLTQHQGFVKGITWDPAGKFLATQSDDKSVILWRVADWQTEKVISEPYATAASTTFFRRLSWSPDGSQLATANAANSGLPSAAVITRDTWRSDVHFVGHDAAVEVVRFNPRIFRSAKASDDATAAPFCTVCAVGSQDHSVTFWTTPRPRPLLVARDVFQHSVLDIAWSQDGLTAFVCSFDGSVAVIQFGADELGESLTANEQDAYFSSLGLQRKTVRLAETPEQLSLEEEHAVARATQASSRLANLMGDSGAGTIRNSSDRQSTSAAPMVTAPLPPPPPSTPVQQRVTITADGRKRIQPLFVRSMTGTPSRQSNTFVPPAPPTPGIRRDTAASLSKVEEHTTARSEPLEVSPPSRAMPPGGLESIVVGQKRLRVGDDDMNAAGTNGKQQSRPATVTRPAFIAPELAVSAIRLSVPKVQSTFFRSGISDAALVYECQNPTSGKVAAKIVCSRQGSILWRQALPSAILLLVASSMFSAAACEDGTLHLFSPAGRRLLPCLCLSAPASFIDCNGHYLMCLTSAGLVHVWDVSRRKAVLANESIAPLLFSEPAVSDEPSESVTITDARVQANGVVLLCTSNGCAFAFDADMRVWSRVVDAWYSASEFYAPVTGLLGQQAAGGPLAVAQVTAGCTQALQQRAIAGELLQTDRELQKIIAMSHLESQVASARLLMSPDEYQHWLINYARRLASEAAVERAAELCRELFGPSYPTASNATTTLRQPSQPVDWEPTVLGLVKHDLLRSVLPILANNRDLQRLAHEYTEALQRSSDVAARR